MTTPDIKKMTTPEEIIEFYNFKTEKKFKTTERKCLKI